MPVNKIYHTGTVWPSSAYFDAGDVYFYDENGNDIPWHKSFPEEIGDIVAFCLARDIYLN